MSAQYARMQAAGTALHWASLPDIIVPLLPIVKCDSCSCISWPHAAARDVCRCLQGPRLSHHEPITALLPWRRLAGGHQMSRSLSPRQLRKVVRATTIPCFHKSSLSGEVVPHMQQEPVAVPWAAHHSISYSIASSASVSSEQWRISLTRRERFKVYYRTATREI